MSLAGQVLCHRMEIGPVCALAIMGAETAPAATAMPLRRLRRRGVLFSVKMNSNQNLRIKAPNYCLKHIMGSSILSEPSENPCLVDKYFNSPQNNFHTLAPIVKAVVLRALTEAVSIARSMVLHTPALAQNCGRISYGLTCKCH